MVAMNSIVRNNPIFCVALFSVLLHSCLFVGSDKSTRVLKRIRNGNRSENFTQPSSNIGKANLPNYFGKLSRKTTQNHKCNSISCISMGFLDKRLETIKRKLLNYYDKRSQALANSRDGIGFPSLEGALLSLAFLTFAVFLIDLIQQLLSRLRLGAGAGMTPVAVLGRRKRSWTGESSASGYSWDPQSTTAISIVSAIENPRFVYSSGVENPKFDYNSGVENPRFDFRGVRKYPFVYNRSASIKKL